MNYCYDNCYDNCESRHAGILNDDCIQRCTIMCNPYTYKISLPNPNNNDSIYPYFVGGKLDGNIRVN